MILGIDAHCIRGVGGSVTHLKEVLRVADPAAAGFVRVIVWAPRATLDQIDDRPWLEKAYHPLLEKSLLYRSWFSARMVDGLARRAGCDVLWLPGCSYGGHYRPFVAMSRNMLPFDWREMRRFGVSPRFLKFFVLRFSQSATYRRADGMMFLTGYARDRVNAVVGRPDGASRVIPHGVETRFAPSGQLRENGDNRPWRLLYVSAVDLYKHQWHVVSAVHLLQQQGIDVELTLIGPSWPAAEKRLRSAIERTPIRPGSVRWIGHVKHAELHAHYQEADLFVYASSCENLPNILLEAMGTGKPIACSDRGPMPEVLRDAGVYFDPESPASIATSVRRLIDEPDERHRKAALAIQYSREYSWRCCASESFNYLAEVAATHRARHAVPAATRRSVHDAPDPPRNT
jgi:glycosyltransferase involved in cell wall biosynthesis